jgi:phage-related protein
MPWQIILYESGEQKPVEDFIKSLQPSTIDKVTRQLELLEEFGPLLLMPHARPMGGGLYELRVRGKHEIRMFYVFAKAKDIYILHGFVKKTQETPRRELRVAIRRKGEIRPHNL